MTDWSPTSTNWGRKAELQNCEQVSLKLTPWMVAPGDQGTVFLTAALQLASQTGYRTVGRQLPLLPVWLLLDEGLCFLSLGDIPTIGERSWWEQSSRQSSSCRDVSLSMWLLACVCVCVCVWSVIWVCTWTCVWKCCEIKWVCWSLSVCVCDGGLCRESIKCVNLWDYVCDCSLQTYRLRS
jgi:hypothetical protein